MSIDVGDIVVTTGEVDLTASWLDVRKEACGSEGTIYTKSEKHGLRIQEMAAASEVLPIGSSDEGEEECEEERDTEREAEEWRAEQEFNEACQRADEQVEGTPSGGPFEALLGHLSEAGTAMYAAARRYVS